MNEPTDCRISVYNAISNPEACGVLMFLLPETPQEDDIYCAWKWVDPVYSTSASVTLTDTFAASVAEHGISHSSSPVELLPGEALTVMDDYGQIPYVSRLPSPTRIAPGQVGLYNGTDSPPAAVRVLWYVGGAPVVWTNNSTTNAFEPTDTSTFELQQSIWMMFGPRPDATSTYVLQDLSSAVKIPIPQGATAVYVEAYTTADGVDTFRVMYHSGTALAQPVGAPGSEQVVARRHISDVSVLPLHHDAVLRNGIGYIDTDEQILVCGVFPANGPLPQRGEPYVIRGVYDDTRLPFAVTLDCAEAGRPSSRFVPRTPIGVDTHAGLVRSSAT